MTLDQAARGQIERVVARQPLTAGQHARPDAQLGGRIERVPDGPGIDASAFESGTRIGRSEIHRLNVGPGNTRLVQRTHQQVMGA
ncbi:hypothetical protein SDC9_166115 [bioreactor metagenome]|uniref:Uncharacterized protein n=1 Tax=bioreactor metagenome TaxID=1076179 RepID=A0A645FYH4_9ZZZZ